MHTQHTPGPWTCHPTLTPEYDDDPMGCYTVEPAASSLQERFNKADFDSEMLEPIHNENRANARLIAAAPELLEALKILLVWDDGNLPGDLMEQARAAVAKAEGRTP